MSDGPRMSVVVVTDRYETIRGVVQRLGRQTVAGELELVIVGPAGAGVAPDAADVAALHGHREIEVDDIMPLWLSRAAGVRATVAPIVTVGETHCLPRPDWAATVLAAFDAGHRVVVPGFANANPGEGAISWSNLLADYGRWSRALPPGEDGGAPAYNTTFGREVLDGLGEDMDDLYAPGFDAPGAIHRQGRVIWREPRAVVHHINVSRRRDWWKERYRHGRVQAAHRARAWGRPRRALYIVASPLIVPVTMRRVWPGYRAAKRGEDVPRLTGACLIVGATMKTIGEVLGFAFGADERHERGVDELEVHKLRYTRRGVAGLTPDA